MFELPAGKPINESITLEEGALHEEGDRQDVPHQVLLAERLRVDAEDERPEDGRRHEEAERVAEEGALVARALEVAHLDDRVRTPEEVGRREERDAEEAVDGGHHDAEGLWGHGSHCCLRARGGQAR